MSRTERGAEPTALSRAKPEATEPAAQPNYAEKLVERYGTTDRYPAGASFTLPDGRAVPLGSIEHPAAISSISEASGFAVETGEWVLDVTATPSSLEEAMSLAREKGQKAIFDLKKMEEVPVTAEAPEAALKSELLEAARAGKPVADWWERSRAGVDALAMANPQAAAELKQMIAATSARKSNEAGAALALNVYREWVEAGRPTSDKAIRRIIGKYKQFSPVGSSDPHKVGAVVRGEPLTSKSDPRNLKIPEMARVLGGDDTAVVLDTHMQSAFGTRMRGAEYKKAAQMIGEVAKEAGMAPSEAQAAIWSVIRLMKDAPDLETALRSLGSDDILRAGEDYADLIANDPEVRAASRRRPRGRTQASRGTPSQAAQIRQVAKTFFCAS